MKFLRYLTFAVSLALTSCSGDDAPQQPRQEVTVEEGITYHRTEEGFWLFSQDDPLGFQFEYSHENRACSYENHTNPAQTRMYTDRGCDESIDSTLFVDCSDPNSCIILDIDEDVRHRDLEQLTEVRERLRVDHYQTVWQRTYSTRNLDDPNE